MKKKKIIVCNVCGEEQELDLEFPYCKKCGVYLLDKKKKQRTIIPIKWENLKGYSIISGILFAFVFIFLSRYYGGAGIVVSFLIYLYSKEKIRQSKKNKND